MEMKFYSVEAIAKMLGISTDPIYKACEPDKITKKAMLANYRIGMGKSKPRIIVLEQDLKDFLKRYKIEAINPV